MNDNNHPIPVLPALSAGLVDVALIDADACAAAGSMSVSWWHDAVRDGRAPKPVVQRPRCTRWRLVDVRAFWSHFAESGPDDIKAADAMKAKLTKASAKAHAQRSSKGATAKASNVQAS